jgi:hypothetical protein
VPDIISAIGLIDTVYLTSILADQPRSIDRYIDYFGNAAGDAGRCSSEARCRPHQEA